MSDKPAATPVPAATILLLRDGTAGLEVFMVKRHHQVDFVSGALVFPGGKVDATDREEALAEYCDGAQSMDAARRALMVCAIREAFEESGILLARDGSSGAFVGSERLERLAQYRKALDRHEIGMAQLLRRENLRLALDQLALFAHWITPANMPKRFDTLFFAAPSPVGHAGSHDGRESVDSVWIGPEQAIADRKNWNIVFPTKLNLMKLAGSRSVADAMAAARASQPLTVTPWVEQSAEGPILRIREDAGYAQTWVKLKEAL